MLVTSRKEEIATVSRNLCYFKKISVILTILAMRRALIKFTCTKNPTLRMKNHSDLEN